MKTGRLYRTADPIYFRTGGFFRDCATSAAKLPPDEIVFVDPLLAHSYPITPYTIPDIARIDKTPQEDTFPLEITATEDSLDASPNMQSVDPNFWRDHPYSLGFATSGSTGEPKIISKTQNEIYPELEFWKEFVAAIDLAPTRSQNVSGRKLLAGIPLCHIYGFLWGFALPHSWNLPTVSANTLGEILQSLATGEIGLWITVPSQLKAIRDYLKPDKHSTNGGVVVSSGSRLDCELARWIQETLHCKIIEIYGSTETGAIGYRYPAESEKTHFLPFVEGRIENECLVIRSPLVHPDLRSLDGSFRLEDLGVIENDGFTYKGRSGRIVKRNGKRVHLDQVEKALMDTGLFEDVVAVDLASDSLGDAKIGALVVSRNPSGQKVSQYEPENSNGLLSQIPGFQMPSILVPNHLMSVTVIPKLANGKKDYNHARTLFP